MGATVYTLSFFIGGILGRETGFVDTPTTAEQTGVALGTEVGFVSLLSGNAVSALIVFLGGLSFGLLSGALVVQNGLVHGSIVGTLATETGETVNVVLLFAPHAVMELPAIFLAFAAGVVVPVNVVSYLRGDGILLSRRTLVDAVTLFVASELLIVGSALVEYYLTYGLLAQNITLGS